VSVPAAGRCPGGHQLAHPDDRGGCRRCRWDGLVDRVAAADPSLQPWKVAAAVDAVVTSPAVLRDLAAALAADPAALSAGAPPVVGRLVAELVARGSATLRLPACAVCGRTGRPLTRSGGVGVCFRCRRRQLATACARCGVVKPVAARDGQGRPVCARCSDRPQRRCGTCGQVRRVARRGSGGQPDLCVNCYRLPDAVCAVCGCPRPCNFAASGRPVCKACAPRRVAPCAHCGQPRPPAARWPEGPVCDRCYSAALRRRGPCVGCGAHRRLVAPPGPDATTCADCAGQPATHVCTDCGIEDKLYERGRCARCSLRRRAGELLRAGATDIPAELVPVWEAIVAAHTPRTALHWLRKGAGAAILVDLVAGRLPATHQALDTHPRRRAADYLRHMLIAHGVLPPRDQDLAHTEQWVADLLARIQRAPDRRLVQAYATWRVLRRLRRRAERNPGPRTSTPHARVQIRAAADWLAWLAERGIGLADCRQADVDGWLATGPAAYDVGDFLAWAGEHRHCRTLHVPRPERRSGTATDQDERWAIVARLLHDDTLQPTDRVAGSLLLLYGQQLSRITTMTTDQILRRDGAVLVRFGQHDLPLPEPLAGLLLDLIHTGRHRTGVGSPTTTRWLFPGQLPGRPLTAARLGARLRNLGIHARAGRRAALFHLAAQLPAAVLADLLHLAPTTAVRWVRDAGGDWSHYAAQLARSHNHKE